MDDEELRIFYREAEAFVRGDGSDLVKKAGGKWKTRKPQSLKRVYFLLVDSLLSNRKVRERVGRPETFSGSLFAFDPLMVEKRYGDHWTWLCGACEAEDPKRKGFITHMENFAKAALSGAIFMTKLGTIEMFHDLVEGYYDKPSTAAVLPVLLDYDIENLGFGCACRFLNKSGYPDYEEIKTPVKALLNELGITTSREDHAALEGLIRIARLNSVYGVTGEIANQVLWRLARALIDGIRRLDSLPRSLIDRLKPLLLKGGDV